MYEIVTIDTPTLGDRSYLVHDGRVAVVIDPQRDVDRVLNVASDHGVTITHVFETHVHNDYVSGGRDLSARTGAQYLINAADEVRGDHVAISDGDTVEVSPTLRLRVVATPGHTFTHLSYVLDVDGETIAVFSGGSLLYGSTGRPDLLGAQYADGLARHQFASAQRLATELPDATLLLPTHGFGSFCSSSQSQGESSTVGLERDYNPALRLDEDDYVAQLLAGLDAYPAYYAHMGPTNAAGAEPIDLSPPRIADPEELRRRIGDGEWVVDLRHRSAYAAGHLVGSLSAGLDGSFATYVGWLIPWGTPVTLLGATAEDVAAAQRELARIGIDRPTATALGGPDDWTGPLPLATLRRVTFADLADRGPGSVLLDVRRDLEWNEGHIEGAVHIALHDLPGRLDEVPAGEVWVHCRSGYRATLAASLLARAGRHSVVVDDDFPDSAPVTETDGAAAA